MIDRTKEDQLITLAFMERGGFIHCLDHFFASRLFAYQQTHLIELDTNDDQPGVEAGSRCAVH